MQVDEGTLTLKAILQTIYQGWLGNILIFNTNTKHFDHMFIRKAFIQNSET
jgi:hypothetical protein